jgi:2-amino-4-hydroxy-6-hydroxymethyldihydropteridine diphosphokinase
LFILFPGHKTEPLGDIMSEKIILSLGSNMGDRLSNLKKACESLRSNGFEIDKISSVHETEPVGMLDQNYFYNIAVSGYFGKEPDDLLNIINRIESELGRERVIKYGPRTIDIDIIFFGEREIHSLDLMIPHPEYRFRRFVLEPVLEIEPEITDVSDGRKLKTILSECVDNSKVIKKDEIQS